MKLKSIFISILIAGLPFLSLAQDDNQTSDEEKAYSLSDHLVYGGNLGLSFGNLTNIGISPMVGYKVTDRFIPGVGGSYNYIKIKYPGYPTQTAQIYGGCVFAKYFITENIFAHAEYEVLNGEWDPWFRPGVRYNLSSVLVGGGYRESFGGLSSYVLLLYNVTQGPDSPYPSPLIIRVGMAVGL
jgi:hypothetical protein